MILIVAAMQSEIEYIEKHIHNDTHLLKTGVGKVNAAFQLAKALSANQYDAIINLGLAGATKPFIPGDVVFIDEATYHDFDLTMFGYHKGQVPGYPPFFKSDQELKKQIEKAISNIKHGTLYTGDRFMTGKMEDAMVFDMESAALFQVASSFHIPIISIKVISDIVGDHGHLENYRRFESEEGSKRLNDVYQKIMKEVIE
jgi:adenosylhomocysteine nucleosidase